MTSLCLNYLFKDPISKYSHILRHWVLFSPQQTLRKWRPRWDFSKGASPSPVSPIICTPPLRAVSSVDEWRFPVSPEARSENPLWGLVFDLRVLRGNTQRSEGTHSRLSFPLFYVKTALSGLPWWRSGWESACQCGGHGFEPRSGRIPRAAERLGPWATVAEPAHLEPVLRNGRGRDGERPAHRDEEWSPLAATGESPRTEARTQHSHK